MLRRGLGALTTRAAPRCAAASMRVFVAAAPASGMSSLSRTRITVPAAAELRVAATATSAFAPLCVVPSHFFSSSSTDAPVAQLSLEELEVMYKRLVFHCQQRGWLELDLIMGSFVRAQRDALIHDADAQEDLRTIAKEENSDLMRWLVEGRPIPEKFQTSKMALALAEYANSPSKPWFPKGGNQ